MHSRLKLVKATKNIGGSILILGIIIFLYGFLVSDYSSITGIGIGTVMGAVFIFIMGMFFAATEEMLENTAKGTPVHFTLHRIK
ncbi:hypothetical protein [Bacillus benzoevorans]|uniref:Uncharacterized protein n=1 Tax=Bacillus benzoevorans TaxID=1456 RepID=A0A7X0HU62_9BACI|nr:hypothetical protein [Bacillus benzoevorans]MBB6446944.1 hypothetical protein [Bacillus benzoevorans]